MVNRNLIRDLEDAELRTAFETEVSFADEADSALATIESGTDFNVNTIIDGRVLRIDDGNVLIDVGFKSEGSIPVHEWDDDEDPPQIGATIKVLIEDVEDEFGVVDDPYGMVSLSKRKAEKIIVWQQMMKTVQEGQVVTGKVTRKIKGGLLVDIGVNVFLPASQVDIRRPSDIGDFIGRTVQCEVLKIDEARRNILVSRRSLIEKQREEDREQLLNELEIDQCRKGVVKNIAEFGAFVDLGGIDGLLHITDMSWERIGHPSEMVSLDEEIECVILHIDREKQKIALGLKQKSANPWDSIETKYDVAKKYPGEVVNVMSYGAFVKLEPGIEGLVHISEMSWTKRINHPNELLNIGDEIDVVILGIDKQGQQLSLGMKQTQENPWDKVLEHYPEGSYVDGKVRNLTNYGAFIELEAGIDGLLHVSDMSWTRKISHPNEMFERGQELKCKVLSVDQDRRRIALGVKQLGDDPWTREIPSKYQPGQIITGTVTKITNFGVFVGLEDGLEGLLHISELAHHKVENPEELVKVGDEIEVKILRVDTEERKIGLSRKRVEWAEEDDGGSTASGGAKDSLKTPPEELKGGLGESGPLIKPSDLSTTSSESNSSERNSSESASPESAGAESPSSESASAESADTESADTESDVEDDQK